MYINYLIKSYLRIGWKIRNLISWNDNHNNLLNNTNYDFVVFSFLSENPYSTNISIDDYELFAEGFDSYVLKTKEELQKEKETREFNNQKKEQVKEKRSIFDVWRWKRTHK